MNSVSVEHLLLYLNTLQSLDDRDDVFLLRIRNLTQWPLPPVRPALESPVSLNSEQTRDQLNELEKKITPVQNVIISLRPRQIYSLFEHIPDFDFHDEDSNITDHNGQSTSIDADSDDNDPKERLSNRIYDKIDGRDRTRT